MSLLNLTGSFASSVTSLSVIAFGLSSSSFHGVDGSCVVALLVLWLVVVVVVVLLVLAAVVGCAAVGAAGRHSRT